MPLLLLVALALSDPTGPATPVPQGEDDAIELGPPIDPMAGASLRRFARWSEQVALPLDPARTPSAVISTLALGLDWEPNPTWSFALEGRLRHHLAAALAPFEAPPDADPTRVAGRLGPELRRALIRWRPGPELALGLDRVRLGRSQLARPLDRLNPLDWREGPLAPEGGERLPVPVASVRTSLGDGELLLAWVPFFVAPRLPLRPSYRDPDAPSTNTLELTPSSPLLSSASGPGGPLARVNDLGELLSGPQDLLRSSELALRWTQRFGALDLALTWLFQRDRVPDLAEPSQRARQHVLGLDLSCPIGPIRAVAEAAIILDQRVWLATPSLPTQRHALVHATLEAAATPTIFLDLTVGLEALVALDASDTTRFVFGGPRDLWLNARLNLLLAFDGVLRLDAETHVALLRADHLSSLVLAARLATDIELALGLSLFGGNPMDGGLGGLYESRDSLWVRAVFEL